MTRLDWRLVRFSVGFLLFLAGFLSRGFVTEHDASAPTRTALADRLERHCALVRWRLGDELDALFASSAQKQVAAQLMFQGLMTNDWREVALCAPDGVHIAERCTLDDVPCMAAAVGNALVATNLL